MVLTAKAHAQVVNVWLKVSGSAKSAVKSEPNKRLSD